MNDAAYVFTGTFEQFKGAIIAFKRIRDLGSTLPIYFFTNELINGENDLSKAKKYNCVIIHVNSDFNCNFSHKIQSILDSIAKEVIFCDCDILPIKNLEILFDSSLYKSKGYVLFQDSQVSTYKDGTPQTDSGVMLWNKSIWAEHLFKCLKFTERYHDSVSMGDKESYYNVIKNISHMPKIPDFIGFKIGNNFFGCSMLHYYKDEPIFIHSTLMKFHFNIKSFPLWAYVFKNKKNILLHKKCDIYNRYFINNPTDEKVSEEIFKLNDYLNSANE
jgi:hypothetical protein